MTALVNGKSVRDLLGERTGPCVSLYLTTHRAGPEARQDPLRFEHLLARAEAELQAAGVPHDDAQTVLAPALQLLADPATWRGSGSTIAVFAAPGFFRSLELAAPAGDQAVVGSRFHLRPLLPALATPARFYVLAISRKQVRLIEATPEGCRRLSLPGVPASLAEAMAIDEFNAELQVHSGGGSGAARRLPIVHGHGGAEERKDEDLRHWFKRIASGLAAQPLDRSAPIVLATTREHVSRYCSASRDPQLLGQTVIGSPDLRTDSELAARARPLVEESLAQRREEELRCWGEQLGSGHASGDLRTVLVAAREGRVRTLIVPVGGQVWGFFDAATGNLELPVERRVGDEELLERAAIETLCHGGEVYEMECGAQIDGAPLAALLRG